MKTQLLVSFVFHLAFFDIQRKGTMSSISKNHNSARSRKEVANVARNRIRSDGSGRIRTAPSHEDSHIITQERLDALNNNYSHEDEKCEHVCKLDDGAHEVGYDPSDERTASGIVEEETAGQQIYMTPVTPVADDPLDEIGNPPRVLRICCVPFVIR